MKSASIRYYILLLFIWGFTICSCCQNGEWRSAKKLIPKKKYQSSCVFQNKIYVFGGLSFEEYKLSCIFGSHSVHAYDPISNTWESKMQMPKPRAEATAEVVGNKIYLIGGWSGFPTLQRYEDVIVYDPVTNSWENDKIAMLSGRKSHGSCVVGDEIFVIGGLDDDENGVNTVEAYNTKLMTWDPKADMPTARGNISVSYLNGKIYVFGGNNSYLANPLTNIEIYDISLNSWKSAETVLPKGLTSHSAIVYDDMIYLAGGVSNMVYPEDGHENNYNIIAFHPVKQEFYFITKMPESGGDISFHLVKNEFYVLEGQDLYPTWTKCDNLNIALKYIPVKIPIFAINGEINKSFMYPQNDAISFRTSFSNIKGRHYTAKVNIINSDSVIVNSYSLYDDGQHWDLLSGDGVFGNFIRNISEEDVFSIEVLSIPGSGNNEFKNLDVVRKFCTIGPVRVYDPFVSKMEISLNKKESTIDIELSLVNEGAKAIAKNISVELFSPNPDLRIMTKAIEFEDIHPGGIVKGNRRVEIKFSDGYNWSQEIPILVSIKSGNLSFWNDKIIIKPAKGWPK